MFQIIEFTGTGGKTILVDGFKVAEELKRKNPEAYEILSNTPIPTHYLDAKENVNMKPITNQPIFVTLKNENEGGKKGTLIQIRYNNDDRAPLNNLAPEDVPKFYEVFSLSFFLQY